MERENQDLVLEQIKLKSAEQRTTVLESIKSVMCCVCTGPIPVIISKCLEVNLYYKVYKTFYGLNSSCWVLFRGVLL